MTFSSPWRKVVLVLHVTSSLGFLGAVAAFLALALTGTTAEPALATAAYQSMRVITWQVIVPLAFATLVIGLVQSAGTPWGIFRYYWVIVKLVLTLIALGILMLQTQTVDALAAAAMSGDLTGMAGARFSMLLHGTGGMLVLLVATVLSVYKPRGLTARGALALKGVGSVSPVPRE